MNVDLKAEPSLDDSAFKFFVILFIVEYDKKI